jgi:bacterial/archaeal transporter family-2 protein
MDILSALSGVMIAIMILMNGQLSEVWGCWTAAVIIHMAGLIVVLLWMLLRREKPFVRSGMPILLYLGGAVGAVATVFTNMATPVIGVSATLALGLLGQTAASQLLDGFGLLGAKKARFRLRTAAGMALIAAGIWVMMLG